MRRWFVKGETVVASIGLAIAAILFAAMAASAWWGLHVHRELLAAHEHEEQLQLTRLVGETLQPLLQQNDLPAVRSFVLAATRHSDVHRISVALPNGSVIADSDASRITQLTLPSSWNDERAATVPVPASEHAVQIHIPGRGALYVQIDPQYARSDLGAWKLQSGIAVVGLLSMLTLLFVYRRVRKRLTVLGLIDEALADYENSKSVELLFIDPSLSPHAKRWNDFISERQRLESDLRKQKVSAGVNAQPQVSSRIGEAIDSLRIGLVLIDEANQVVYTNDAACRMLNGRAEDFKSCPLDALVTDAEVLSAVRTALDRKARHWVSDELRCGQDNGRTVLRISSRMHTDHRGSMHVLVLEDITQQTVASEARDSFIGHVAHELRSPITTIRLYVEELIEGGDSDPQLWSHGINVIASESFRLSRLIDDMLSIAAIESGSYVAIRDDVDVDALVRKVVGDLSRAAEEKSITLSLDVAPKLPVIQGDREKLIRIVQNLVDNAIKYTPEGGTVDVSAKVEDGELVVEVTDSGFGIRPEEQQRIFEKFYRTSDARMKSITGSGLGLAITRSIAQLHGGDIRVHSEPDVGSTFTLSLPHVRQAA